jgi:predicted alpha/beta-fold hydrolase
MIIQSQFRPAFGLSNCHLQTVLPLLLKTRSSSDYYQHTLELDDGDFLDLSWTSKPVNGKPTVVIFHGLEGSVNSHYVKSIMHALGQCGWQAVLMHFRGCSGRPNRLPRSYHSGETGDARYVLSWIENHYPDSPLAAVGYSLGGNMLLKLQAEYGDNSPLEMAVCVCAPVQLDLCANRLMQGLSRFYQRHLMTSLKDKCLAKADKFDFEKLIGMSRNHIKKIKTFWQFDDVVTAPLHGFENVDDYYARSSSRQYLKAITKPTLMIHALDDPFMSADIVPDEGDISESVVLEVSRYGGHVGFIAGSAGKPVFWLPKRITEALSSYMS